MRKDEKWGYVRYDMKYDPIIFPLKVLLVNLISPAYPLGGLHWESIEKVNINITIIFYLSIEIYSRFTRGSSLIVCSLIGNPIPKQLNIL